MKYQVRWTEFLVYFKLDFYWKSSWSNLIFQNSSTDQQEGVSSSAQGPFTNYVDKISPIIIDHLYLPPVDIWDGITLLLLNTIENSHVPTLSSQRSLWMPLTLAFRLWRKKSKVKYRYGSKMAGIFSADSKCIKLVEHKEL